MIYYLIKVGTKPYKNDEFIAFVSSLSPKITKEKGCKGFKLYADSAKEGAFVVVGEWDTREAMEVHFQKANYEILVGSARVLGETLEINISEVLETGGFEQAQDYLASPQLVDNPSD